MLIRNCKIYFGVSVLFLLTILAGPLQAQVEPDREGLGQAEFRLSELDIENNYRLPAELPGKAMPDAVSDLGVLGLSANAGRVDVRGGRWATLIMAEPLLPGQGKGNNLGWSSLGIKAPKNDAELASAASRAFREYISAASNEFRIDIAELANPGKITVQDNGNSIHIYAPRVFNGVPVRGSYVTATINRGNLTLFGANHWGDINASTVPGISESDAEEAVQSYVGAYPVTGAWGKSELVLVPIAKGQDLQNITVGQGYDYLLAWVIRPAFDGDMRNFEALVEAQTGELLSFVDTNQYAEVKGGVLPVSNDGIAPDGVEQPGWPMPFMDTTLGTTDTGGNVPGSGSINATFFGPYVNINDNCGADSLTQNDNIDWGSSAGTDCATPGFGGAGNTHASRTGFYELNKVIEMARGQLPGNLWLQSRLTSNMNINNTCNAFWNGTVNFYRSGGGCFNTGELAGVFDHEWGHGLDANDATPGIASPSGEGIADIYTALRLNNSCIGRNFRATNCTGFGDPCLSCTGVRDIDYLKRASGQPHDYTWSNANCGSVHCVGAVYAEAVWSLWKRELQSAPYNMDNNTAHEVVNRLTFIGAGNTGTWFSGGPPNGGCAGTSGYMNYLAADDDNGDLNDGTPHMTAIFNAFNDQEIACATPTVQDSGCSNSPTAAPVVSGTPSDKSVGLSWNPVANATEYEVFRTEGVFACDFGKVKLGATTGTVWNDTGLQNGRDYSYVVIPKGSANSCFGPASSCTTVTPASGPNLAIDTGSSDLVIAGGDSDPYLDNCEEATMSFDVNNTGLGTLTNVHIVGVTPSNGGVTVTTGFPLAISPSTLSEGGTGSGGFSVNTGGLAPGETLTFQVEVNADELDSPRFADLVVTSTETDLTFNPTVTYSFESDAEGWTTVQGTFNRASAGGGANGTSWYEQSSASLDNQCDQVQSPVMVFSSTSTLTLSNQHDIEPLYTNGQWYDRANVGIVDVATGTRSPVSPDGGRLYNASGVNGTCGTTGQGGWADTASTWATSSWSAGALGSAGLDGQAVQFDVRYGTDSVINGSGFRFDEVTVTDVSLPGADGQNDICNAGCTQDLDCDDGAFCNGAETCNIGTGLCEAGTAPACDDGLFCNGGETCNESTDSCDAGTAPACDDGAFCNGTETCNEGTDSCDAGTPPVCDDGAFCNGAETCNEGTDSCNAGTAPACDDGAYCNGIETCNEGTDSCDAGTPVVCDDGLFCNGTDTCNEGTDSCAPGTPPVCDDGAFCNGTETCNEGTDSCDTGTAQCTAPGEACDEGNDTCVPAVCNNNGTCEEGEDCGNCASDCVSGSIPGASCGNGLCEAGDGENAVTCSADCNGKLNGKPADRFACGFLDGYNPDGCGDARCNSGGFSCTEVPVDAGSYCCGDGICESPESGSSCALDCGEPPPGPVCGNGIIELGEMCDSGNLGGETCSSQGFVGGNLACQSDCLAFDTSDCSNNVCVPTHSKEKGPRCSDTIDNDCDGKTDGADPDCQ